MEIPLFQVDAFASRLFTGNPAAVCPLNEWLDDATLQSIAAENNLAETAFYVQHNGTYHLRWFTPTVEVDLCGHATLASAYVIMNHFEPERREVRFESLSGELQVSRDGDIYSLDFPARAPERCAEVPALTEALGARPSEIWAGRDYMAVFPSEHEVSSLRPNMEKLAALDRFAVIVTAPGTDVDFVSRFFAPARGIPEDPVTGSAHCTLTPYWSNRLGKRIVAARQISPRTGDLTCEYLDERVRISGRAVLYLTGAIHL